MKSKNCGQAIVESVVGIVMLVVLALVAFDLSMLFWGAELNAQTCSEAARAAAEGDPNEASRRAQAVIDRKGQGDDNSLISASSLAEPVALDIKSMPEAARNPETGAAFCPGGPVIGTVTVVTEAKIKQSILSIFLPDNKSVTVRAKQSFPFTYVMPAAKEASSGDQTLAGRGPGSF